MVGKYEYELLLESINQLVEKNKPKVVNLLARHVTRLNPNMPNDEMVATVMILIPENSYFTTSLIRLMESITLPSGNFGEYAKRDIQSAFQSTIDQIGSTVENWQATARLFRLFHQPY